MQVVSTVAEARAAIARARAEGARIGLVPTMGNLHAGHLSLVRAAGEAADYLVASIFINPLQFGAGEDLAAYPRTMEEDRRRLSGAGVALLFAPTPEQVYPRGLEHTTRVEVPDLGDILCGASRPGHFIGVTTVVNILINALTPDVAVFGRKDYQQLLLIRRMVADLCMPVRILSSATVREADGLAMSSRNAYLDPAERVRAPALYRALSGARARIEGGARDFETLEREGMEALHRAGLAPEYFAIRDAGTLAVPAERAAGLAILAAARLGRARLIDNLTIGDED